MSKSEKSTDLVVPEENSLVSNECDSEVYNLYSGGGYENGELIDNEFSLATSDEGDVLRKYIQHVSQFPMLSAEDEERLFNEYFDNGNQQAGQAIVLSHMRLVVKIALQYRRYGINIMDLIAEGNAGLMKALQKFDRSKHVRFSTYAVLWIKSCIQDFILKSWSMVKVGSVALRKQLLFNLKGVKQMLKIGADTNYSEQNKKLAQHFGVSNLEMAEATDSLRHRDVELEAPTPNHEGGSLLNTIANNDGNFDDEFADEEEEKYRKKIFRESLAMLNERQREVIMGRYLSERKHTLEELSERLHVSKERVRQIEVEAIRKLKKFAEDYDS